MEMFKKIWPLMLVCLVIAVIGEYTDLFDRESASGQIVTEMIVSYEETKSDEKEESLRESEPVLPADDILTIYNSEDLANLLALKDPMDPSVAEFAEKYDGRTIEFDAAIMFINNHDDYKTRYDIMFYGGDYSETVVAGPSFKFVDVGVHDLGVHDLYLPGYVCAGQNIHIVAEVEKYDSNSGLFILDPVSISDR